LKKAAMPTPRQRIIELLSQAELDARELSQALGIPEKEVYAHLAHVALSVKRRRQKLEISGYGCLDCGYRFESRTRFTRPGRCPRCRGSRITYPRYRIR
jgi:predicted Zn-ribbon and HTH transcriptional regulator